MTDPDKDMLKRARYIEILVDDFKRMFPHHKYSERLELMTRLKELDVESLELLVTQVVAP